MVADSTVLFGKSSSDYAVAALTSAIFIIMEDTHGKINTGCCRLHNGNFSTALFQHGSSRRTPQIILSFSSFPTRCQTAEKIDDDFHERKVEASLQKVIVHKTIFMTFIASFTPGITADLLKLIIAHIWITVTCAVYGILLSFNRLDCNQVNDGTRQCTLIFPFIQVCPLHLESLNFHLLKPFSLSYIL